MAVINQLDGLTDRKTSEHSSPNFDTNHFLNALAAKKWILDSDLDSKLNILWMVAKSCATLIGWLKPFFNSW
jgi:hypothetical protein